MAAKEGPIEREAEGDWKLICFGNFFSVLHVPCSVSKVKSCLSKKFLMPAYAYNG